MTPRIERVPVDPLRTRALELVAAGVTWAEIARWAGYSSADTSGVKRALGVAPRPDRSEHDALVKYETAVRLARALNLDPVDCGV